MTNYTISKFKAVETIGDSIMFNNMITHGTLLITPNPNYVVTASDFSIGSLPSDIKSVVFADTTTAGQLGNTVTVTAAFVTTFVVTGDIKIKLNIIGDAEVWNEEATSVNISVNVIDNTNTNLNAASTFSATSTYTASTSTSGLLDDIPNIATTTISGQVIKNEPTKIASLVVAADSNYYFERKPYLRYINISSDILRLLLTSVVRDSSNRITSYNFDVILSSNVTIDANSNSKALLIYETVAAPVSSTRVINIIHGDSQVSNLGETRPIKIYGDVGAEFDLTITKDSDGSSILNTDIANVDVFDTIGGIVKGFNKKLTLRGRETGITSFSFNNVFPSGTDKYYINIYPKTGTTLGSSIPTVIPHYTIEQYANPVLTISATETNDFFTAPANITYTGRPNAFPNKLKHISSIKEFFSISYSFTHSGGRSMTKVDDDPTWSSTEALDATSATSSDWTNSVPADNGGTHIEIFNIVTTYGVTSTLKADVVVLKWGNANVTMNLDLDTIFAAT